MQKESICKRNVLIPHSDISTFLLHYVLNEEKRADLKKVESILECGHLSFASEEELYKYLKLTKGSATPLGIINDQSNIKLILDKELRNKKILVHPNINTATVSLKYEDLLKVINFF